MTDEKQQTRALASNLRAVHSALIQSLKKRRESQVGKELTALEWFHLLSGSPEYKWMHPLTETMSDIDALLDRSALGENDFAVVVEAVNQLFAPTTPHLSEFRSQYFDAMTADPELVLPHAAIKNVIDKLPKHPFSGDAAEIRRSWHISERRLAHLRATKDKK